MFVYGINRHEPLAAARPLVSSNPGLGTATTVPVHIIPLKLMYKTTVTDPTAADYTGKSPVATTMASPIFNAGIGYKQGKIDVGNTQYEDGYQRASQHVDSV
jgi:hypothetical protein